MLRLVSLLVCVVVAWGCQPTGTNIPVPAVTTGSIADPGLLALSEGLVKSADGRYPTTIVRRQPVTGVPTGTIDAQGNHVVATCGSCHATRPQDRTVRRGEQLEAFHTGLTMAHGNTSCLACHNAQDYGTLKLADGVAVAFADVIVLCSQCHGPQARDYQHGSHGGMQGYWDLTRGPRVRNSCINCHDPHAPAYPKVMPATGPQDRFLNPRTPH